MQFTLPDYERTVEVKTTRKSAKYHFEDDFLPDTWIDYIMGGCYMLDIHEYDLCVLYLMGNYSPPFPKIYADTLIFDDVELEANWSKLMERKKILDQAVITGMPPAPFQHCHDWECKTCRYRLICDTLSNALSIEEDKKLWD